MLTFSSNLLFISQDLMFGDGIVSLDAVDIKLVIFGDPLAIPDTYLSCLLILAFSLLGDIVWVVQFP